MVLDDKVDRCELSAEFVEQMKRMKLSMPKWCSCEASFMDHQGPMSLKEFRSKWHSGARYNILGYVILKKKNHLDSKDFVEIFWDEQHIGPLYCEPRIVFGHVLIPIEIDHIGNQLSGTYGGHKRIQVRGLSDLAKEAKEGDIAIVHFATVIGLIDQQMEDRIIRHQNDDEFLQKSFSQLINIDYAKDLGSLFGQIEKVHKKYRS